MTLILQHELDIIKMYHHTKNEVSMSTPSKVIAQTDTHTDGQTDRQMDRHTHRQYENITSTAYAGGNNNICFVQNTKRKTFCQNELKKQFLF